MFTDFMAGFANREYSITFFDVWGVFDVCSRIAAYQWCFAHKIGRPKWVRLRLPRAASLGSHENGLFSHPTHQAASSL